MALAGKITEYEFTISGKTYSIFGKPGQPQLFISGLTEKGAVNPVPVTSAVSGHTRRRYPGGPSISVSGHNRTSLRNGRGLQRTLPGENAYFEVEVTTGGTAKVDVTTITHTAPFHRLFDYVQQNAIGDFVLRSADGTPYPITEPVGP